MYRGANGGLAGSDVRILHRSFRKCIVTGINSHELKGLDVVQCAALVETNHGIVNLIMNKYACYVKDTPSIPLDRLSGSKTQLMTDLSKLVGKQRICTIDGNKMPLVCRGGFMYLSLLGKTLDEDFQRYPAVHLTGPHEWVLENSSSLSS